MEENNMQTRESGRKKEEHKGRKWFFRITAIVLLIILLLLLLHQCGYFKYPWEKEPPRPVVAGDLFPDTGDAENGHLPNMSPDEIKAQMQKIADESQFSFKINSRPVFADGKSAGDLGIENPNYNVYPMVVQIFLKDTDELIYDSGGILPNQHVSNAKLLKELQAGTYEATAVLNAYDPNTKVWQGKAQAALVITVQN